MAKPKEAEADELAVLCVRAHTTLVRAGRLLHDDVGPLLSAAGLRLQLLRMDVPAAADQVNELLQVLDQALEDVRELSQDLTSLASRGGLKNALLQLAETYTGTGLRVSVEYSATAIASPEIASMLYDAVERVVAEAVRQRATKVDISATGNRGLRLRITDNGRKQGRTRAFSIARRLAREAGITVDLVTGKSTIVSIRYAFRRSTRR